MKHEYQLSRQIILYMHDKVLTKKRMAELLDFDYTTFLSRMRKNNWSFSEGKKIEEVLSIKED